MIILSSNNNENNDDIINPLVLKKVEINNCIKKIIKNISKSGKSQSYDKNKIILRHLLKLTKSNGGYISTVVTDDNKQVALSISALEILNFNHPDVYTKSVENIVGAYFPMKKGLLHTDCIEKAEIIICNDPVYLQGHQCPGLKIRNVILIPIFIGNSKDTFAILTLSNSEYNYTPNLVNQIKTIIDLIAISYNFDEYANERIQKENNKLTLGNTGDMTTYIIKNSTDIAAVFSLDGKILIKSPSFDREIRALSVLKLNDINSLSKFKKCKNLSKIRKHLLQTSRSDKFIQEFDTLSGIIYYNSTYGIIYGNNDEKVGYYFLAKNITNEKHLNNELIKTKESLEKALVEKEIYMSRISHELRTPLNAIYGFSQLINVDETIVPEWINIIKNSSKLLLHLVEEVLDISKIGSGKIKLSIENVDINYIVKQSVQILHSEIQSKNISVKLNGTVNNYIRADSHRISQVINNILSNAIKYNKNNGSIDIFYENKDQSLLIKINDTGIGISKDKLDQLGTPFNRLGMECSDIPGSGLGLALSLTLLKQMNCQIQIDSIRDIGTNITITCPLSNDKLPTKKECVSEFLAVGDIDMNKYNKNNLILYIEDNVSNFKFMETVIKNKLGYELLVTCQGTRGIEIAQTVIPKLIILDMGLPDIPGTTVLKILKETPETNKIPIIVYSADCNPTTIELALKNGADMYLTKPADISDLQSAIEKYIIFK